MITKRDYSRNMNIEEVYYLFDMSKVAQGREQGAYYKDLIKMLDG